MDTVGQKSAMKLICPFWKKHCSMLQKGIMWGLYPFIPHKKTKKARNFGLFRERVMGIEKTEHPGNPVK